MLARAQQQRHEAGVMKAQTPSMQPPQVHPHRARVAAGGAAKVGET